MSDATATASSTDGETTGSPPGNPLESADTVLSFAHAEDHCRYDGAAILADLPASDRDVLADAFPTAAQDWSTTTDLYAAVQELEELGHAETADSIAGYIHAENLFGCLCRNEAYETFKDTVRALLDDLTARYPGGTWWTTHRAYAHGLDADQLLEDLGLEPQKHRDDTVTLTLDAFGNGTLASDQPGHPAIQIVGFTTPELGTLVARLDAGDILGDVEGVAGRDTTVDDQLLSGRYATVEAWLTLPEPVRTMMAALYHHDVPLAAPGSLSGQVHAMDLTFGQLRHTAETVTALPAAVADAVRELLPGLPATLEELITAVQAATS